MAGNMSELTAPSSIKPEASKSLETATKVTLVTKTTESVQTPSSSDEVALPTPQRLVERLAIFGSGLTGYSAA
ncbi:MAG: hypothetical protein ACTS5R_02385, partial [Candidatus Hodgkinia cicadicola]